MQDQKDNLFNALHNEAFRALGALEPGQHWSAFDVPIEAARAGRAKILVTTIWNFFSSKDVQGRRTPTALAIVKNVEDGTLWYRIAKPPVGTTRKTWVAHWNKLELAWEKLLPIVGVLKDVQSNKCALSCVFDVGRRRMQPDGSAVWVELIPRGDVGCDVRFIDIEQIAAESMESESLALVTAAFDESVNTSMEDASEERRKRLASAPKFPRRTVTTTSVFDRNPDVVAEVLFQSKGTCGRCKGLAPFLRKSNGTPYLEVHHCVPLAQGGEDTVENAIALCPNCHRESHYG